MIQKKVLAEVRSCAGNGFLKNRGRLTSGHVRCVRICAVAHERRMQEARTILPLFVWIL